MSLALPQLFLSPWGWPKIQTLLPNTNTFCSYRRSSYWSCQNENLSNYPVFQFCPMYSSKTTVFPPIVGIHKMTRQYLWKTLPNLSKISEQRLEKENMFNYVQEWRAWQRWIFPKTFLADSTLFSPHFHFRVVRCRKRRLLRTLPVFISDDKTLYFCFSNSS